jgi:hypothetical protein
MLNLNNKELTGYGACVLINPLVGYYSSSPVVTGSQRVGRGSFITARVRSGGQSLTGGRRERNGGLDGHLLMGRREGDTGVDTSKMHF